MLFYLESSSFLLDFFYLDFPAVSTSNVWSDLGVNFTRLYTVGYLMNVFQR